MWQFNWGQIKIIQSEDNSQYAQFQPIGFYKLNEVKSEHYTDNQIRPIAGKQK